MLMLLSYCLLNISHALAKAHRSAKEIITTPTYNRSSILRTLSYFFDLFRFPVEGLCDEALEGIHREGLR